MFHFYTPWKRQKTYGFLTFSWGIEMEHWAKTGWSSRHVLYIQDSVQLSEIFSVAHNPFYKKESK